MLDDQLKGRTWLIGERLTIADFSIGALVPTAARLGLPLGRFSEIGRWYEGLAALPAWQDAVAAKEAATAVSPHGQAAPLHRRKFALCVRAGIRRPIHRDLSPRGRLTS